MKLHTALDAALTWIMGNTEVQYEIANITRSSNTMNEGDTKMCAFLAVTKSIKPVRVHPLSMMVESIRLKMSGPLLDESDVPVEELHLHKDTDETSVMSVQFEMTNRNGGIMGYVVTMWFRQGFLYRVI